MDNKHCALSKQVQLCYILLCRSIWISLLFNKLLDWWDSSELCKLVLSLTEKPLMSSWWSLVREAQRLKPVIMEMIFGPQELQNYLIWKKHPSNWKFYGLTLKIGLLTGTKTKQKTFRFWQKLVSWKGDG